MFKTVFFLILPAFLSTHLWANSLTIDAAGQKWSLTQEQLLEIGEAELQTQTSWTEGEQQFTGLPLATLLSHLKINAGQLKIAAINDYQITASVEELLSYDAFLAIKLNDQWLRIRDKGPFWLVFPWSQRPDLQRREIDVLSIWQMSSITLLTE